MKLCTDILSDVLTFLHLRLARDNDNIYGGAIYRDIGFVAKYLLRPLIQIILPMDRNVRSINLVC